MNEVAVSKVHKVWQKWLGSLKGMEPEMPVVPSPWSICQAGMV